MVLSYLQTAASARWSLLRDFYNRTWCKVLLRLWALLGLWDLFVSQFMPEETAKRFPKAYQLIDMTSGWLTWEQWALIGLALVVIRSFEYVVRQRSKSNARATSAEPPTQAQIETVPVPQKFSLFDAARSAYSETENCMYALLGRKTAGKGLSDATPQDILDWYAHGLIRHSTVWGQKEPSDTVRQQDLTGYDLDSTSGDYVARKNREVISKLTVSKQDLDAFIVRVLNFPNKSI